METLSLSQLKFVSEILADIGQVFFASMVIPFFIIEFKPEFLLLGLMLAIGAWTGGLLLIKEIKLL